VKIQTEELQRWRPRPVPPVWTSRRSTRFPVARLEIFPLQPVANPLRSIASGRGWIPFIVASHSNTRFALKLLTNRPAAGRAAEILEGRTRPLIPTA